MMLLLNHSCTTPAENLALDEALLEAAEARQTAVTSEPPGEVLRIWESPSLAVVLGRGCRAEDEVDLMACQHDGVPVLRRPSGGGTVLIGPGSLMYTLVLSCQARPELRSIDVAHRTVLDRHVAALRPWLPTVRAAGTSDLACDTLGAIETSRDLVSDASRDAAGNPPSPVRKFSGNSLRVRRDWILYHGTLLYDFPLDTLPRYLRPPPREPAYRQHREHADFVTNAPIAADALGAALAQAWQADQPLVDLPIERVARLVSEKYGRDEWNLRL
jgi:lipoate-protein ligase A